jgi:hypothetical protein
MSTSTSSASPTRRLRLPLWVIEGADIVGLRAVPLRAVTLAICVVGIVLAFLVPDLVPPTPLVGAAVAIAALLLGLAVAVAVDAADLTVRGPRHVRAAGGELVAILPTEPALEDAGSLAGAVLEARDGEDQRLLLGLAAAGRDARRCTAWTDTLALALANTGASVLRVDLASGRSERPGLVEVVREGRKLPDVVNFEPDVRLARVGAGRDHAGALEVLATLPTRLPRDLDVLLVALPTAASRQVVAATRALDHVLVVAERDTTSRVDLIAGLDALEAAGIAAQVVLLDDHTAARLASRPGDVDDATSAVQVDGDPDPLASEDDLPDDGAQADETPDDLRPDDLRPDDLRPDDQRAEAVAAARSHAAAPPSHTAAPASSSTAAARPVAPEPPSTSPEPRTSAPTPGEGEAAAPSVPQAGAHERPPAEPAARDHPPIGLLPGAPGSEEASSTPRSEPATPGAPGTPGRSSVAPRDVEVMLGAAAASAAAQAEVAAEPLPPIAAPRPRPSPESRRAASAGDPAPADAASTAAGSSGTEGPAAAADAELPEPVDVTDELPRIDGRDPRPGRREPDGAEKDDLRTTAKLAILLDDLQARDDRS